MSAFRPGADSGFASSGLRNWPVVAVLILANALAYMDRQILTLLVGPIRATLNITDFQLSLLHGLAFAMFYTVLGIPLGRLADRHNRKRMIVAAVMIWSVMTSLCGLARSFAQLFVTRIAVGAGEAVLAPAAYSLLSDTYPPHQLSRAMSFYMTGIYIGSGFAAISSGALIALVPPLDLGWIGHLEPWQAIFLLLGFPGLLVALLVTRLREPARKGLSEGSKRSSYRDLGRFLVEKRLPLGLFALGSSLTSLIWNAMATWIPTLLIRIHGWSAPEVGLWFGMALLTCGTGGVVTGGFLGSRLRNAGRLDSNVLVGLLSILCAMPLGIACALATSGTATIVLVYCFIFAACLPFGCAASALQEVTPNQMRGQISALYILAANVAGIAIGPSVVAFMTDFIFASDAALPFSLAVTIAIFGPISAIILWIAAGAYRREMVRLGAASA